MDETRLAVPTPPAGPLEVTARPEGHQLYELVQQTRELVSKAKASNTSKAYETDWKLFATWCASRGLVALPASPETVALYITHLTRSADERERRKPATIQRRLTSINTMHKLAGQPAPATMQHPLVSATLQGSRRELGTAQRSMKPLRLAQIVKIIDALEGPIAAARNKALVLIGFVAALRRSELVALEVSDITRHKDGMTLLIRRSKTDQESRGAEVEVLYGENPKTCPVRALENWLAIANITEGKIFRAVSVYGYVRKRGLNPNSVGEIIKRLCDQAGIAHPEKYAGHSLRAGFVTEASANGAADGQIMKQSRHKSITMVRRYARADREDRRAAVAKLGL